MRPTLGFDSNGRLLVSFYEQVDSSTELQMVVDVITAPRAALAGLSDFQEIAVGSTIDFSTLTQDDAIAYGPGLFHGLPQSFQNNVFSTNKVLGWQNSIVAAGSLHPFPQGQRKLFPFWPSAGEPLGSPEPQQVETVRVDFTP